MISITRYPSVTSGFHEEGELYTMEGENLDLLPAQLIATFTATADDAPSNDYRLWPLSSISEDGTKAYFRQNTAHTYANSYTLNRFLTPIAPPRSVWTPADLAAI